MNFSSEAQDTQDMERLVAGKEAALNSLMERHGEKLFHYLLRSLANEGDAADLAQETFVKVYQNRARYDSSQKFSTWLYAIASNLVRDRYRWRSRHPQVSMEAGAEDEPESHLRNTLAAPNPTPEEEVQAGETAAAVRDAVDSLPPELREPLILAVYEELPQAEIAQILNCSVKAVETRIYRARQQLRGKLGTRLGSL